MGIYTYNNKCSKTGVWSFKKLNVISSLSANYITETLIKLESTVLGILCCNKLHCNIGVLK